jgi:spermidine synthase
LLHNQTMNPVELLGQQRAPDSTLLKLVRRGDEYLILADNQTLMSSRMHGSEEALATLACQRARTFADANILVGGLGMGFTLRAALDQLPREATVVIAELLPAVVEWNRGPHGPLGTLAGYPLHDARVRVEIADVAFVLRQNPQHFDAILLDVDNGPAAFTAPQNSALYDADGIAAAHAALKPNGVLAIWSARDDAAFAERLRQAHFTVTVEHVRAHAAAKGAASRATNHAATKKGRNRGPRHTIFLAHKSSIPR